MGKSQGPIPDLLPPNQLTFTYRHVAEHTGLTRYAVSRLVQSGTLKTAQIGDQRKITRASLAAFIHEMRGLPAPSEAA